MCVCVCVRPHLHLHGSTLASNRIITHLSSCSNVHFKVKGVCLKCVWASGSDPSLHADLTVITCQHRADQSQFSLSTTSQAPRASHHKVSSSLVAEKVHVCDMRVSHQQKVPASTVPLLSSLLQFPHYLHQTDQKIFPSGGEVEKQKAAAGGPQRPLPADGVFSTEASRGSSSF